MKTFSIDLGNSSKGTVGAVIRVKAETREKALKTCKELLELNFGSGELSFNLFSKSGDKDPSIEYANVYFNPDALTLDDVGEGEENNAR